MIVLVGLDPGVTTGFALWRPEDRTLGALESLKACQAEARVLALQDSGVDLLVIFEDARLRTWFGATDAKQFKFGAGVREGVGSVKRDCHRWEEFLREFEVPFLPRKPAAGATKWPAAYFARVTGWTGRTDEHQRDAGALVCAINTGMALSLLAQGKRQLEGNGK